MKNRKNFIPIIIGLFMVSCNSKEVGQPTSNESIKSVKIASPEHIDQYITTNSAGTLTTSSEMKLSFKVGGIIQAIYVQPGDKVKSGQVLAQINQAEIQANLNKANEAYEKAKRDLNRVTGLYQDSSATLEQLENVKTALQIAKSDFEIASYNTKYAKIIAPTSGTVLHQFAEVGELIPAGSPIFSVGKSNQAGSQILRVSIADKDLIKLNLGDSAIISFSALPDRTYKGILTEISQAANPATGTYAVEIALTDRYYPELKNGFVGRAKIFSKSTAKLAAIPLKALVEGSGNKAQIFLSNDLKTAFLHSINVISFQDGVFTFKAGEIPENAKVITDGSQYLSPNDSITIQNP